MRRALPALAAVLGISMLARPALAIDPVPSFRYLVTGNGHGFQVFDVSANAVKQYRERPYRFLKANPSNPDGDGIVRRNLAFDTYFGVKVGTGASWLGGRAPSSVGYVDQSNVIHSALATNGVMTESYFVAPFGYEGNALVMLLKVTNTSASAQSVTAYSIHNFKMGFGVEPRHTRRTRTASDRVGRDVADRDRDRSRRRHLRVRADRRRRRVELQRERVPDGRDRRHADDAGEP